MLTGESDAIDKNLRLVKTEHPVNQDRTNIIFSGTLVVRGKATAVVLTTGFNTEMGQIAASLDDDEDKPKTPLQRKLDEFGNQLTIVIAVICLVVWLINIGHFNDPMHGGSWLKGCIYYFKVAVALAVAAIPEGLPAVVTTCLSLGTVKMAKKNAIVRSLPSVETLGSTTVICSDKTGTLTTNKMSVQKVLTVVGEKGGHLNMSEYFVTGDNWSPYGDVFLESTQTHLEFPSAADETLANISRICTLCNEAGLSFEWSQKALQGEFSDDDDDDDDLEAEGEDGEGEDGDGARSRNSEFTRKHGELGEFTKTGTATEAALKVLAEKLGPTDADLIRENLDDPVRRTQVAHDYWNALYERIHVLEFERQRKSMSVVVHDEDERYSLLVKGAPETILERSKYVSGADGERLQLTKSMREDIERHVRSYAKEGLRIIAIAEKPDLDMDQDFTNPDTFYEIETGLTFIGLTCMLDPPRAEVRDSIAKCQTAGIRVIVITGDNQITADSICRRIGVFEEHESAEGKSFTGAEFEAMDEEERLHAAMHGKLFSRVEPRHKYELVQLLQSQGEVVAMTGDGVNDSPALSKADIGVAMGSGTSVAKEAADMVLKDDNFGTIVSAVEEGRAIYANTKQFIRYLISSNIGEVVSIFIVAMLGMPEALVPVQLLWVNLVTDGLPATSLSFNPADKDVMEKPPRGHGEAIISGWTFFRYMVIGVYVGIATALGSAWWFMWYEDGPQLTYQQLTDFHNCDLSSADWSGVKSCEVFEDPRPKTMALSVLVLIELLNALNALSEDQSLLFTLFNNVWVILADLLSLGLHFMILHVPALAGIFHVHPLNLDEWTAVIVLSVPVIFLDEILKFVSRLMPSKTASADGQQKLKQD